MTVTGPVQKRILERLAAGLAPSHLEVENESYKHKVPPDSETHFRLVIISEVFSGQRLLARHRMVNHLLQEELAGPVHALALHTFTGDEWRERYGDTPVSPACRGGEAGVLKRAEPQAAPHDEDRAGDLAPTATGPGD